MKRLNPMKGKIWKTLDKVLKDRYKLVGKLITHKLIEITDENKKETIKTWIYDKPLEELTTLFATVKIEKPKKVKKPRAKKVVKPKPVESESDDSSDEEEEEVKVKTKVVKKKRRMMDSDSESDSEDEVDFSRTVPI